MRRTSVASYGAVAFCNDSIDASIARESQAANAPAAVRPVVDKKPGAGQRAGFDAPRVAPRPAANGALEQALRSVRAEWEAALREHAPRNAWTPATTILADQGFFTELAIAAAEGMPRARKSELTTKLIRQAAPALVPLVPQPLLFLQRWLTRITSRVEPKAELQFEPRPTHRQEVDGDREPRADRRPRAPRASEEKLRVDKQKEAVLRALENDRVDLAARYAEELVESQARSGRPDLATKTLCDLATRAKDRGRLALAERWLEEAVARAPNDPVAWNQIITLRRRQGQTRELLAWSAVMFERFPENVYAHSGRAEALRAAGRLHEACEVYERALRRFPANAFLQNARAVVLRGLGRLPEALAAHEGAVALAPDDEFALTGRAAALKALGRLDESLAAYEDAFARYPDRAWIRNWRAEAMKAVGDVSGALAAYEETVRLFPRNVLTRNGHAAMLVAAGRIDEALAATAEVARLFPDDLYARTSEAFVLAQAGRGDAARAAYEAVLARAPNDEHVRTGLGLVLALQDQFTQAERLLSDKPPPASAREWYRALGVGLVVMRRGELDRADEIFRRGARLCPFARHKLRFESALGLTRMHRGDPLRVAKQLGALPPTRDALGDVTRRLILAHALVEAGRSSEARAQLARPIPFGYRCVRDATAIITKAAARGGSSQRLAMREDERLWDAEIELLSL